MTLSVLKGKMSARLWRESDLEVREHQSFEIVNEWASPAGQWQRTLFLVESVHRPAEGTANFALTPTARLSHLT